MKVRTGKDEEEKIDERVQQGRVLDTDRYKYLRIIMNTEGYINEKIQEMEQKENKIIQSNSQVWTEEI